MAEHEPDGINEVFVSSTRVALDRALVLGAHRDSANGLVRPAEALVHLARDVHRSRCHRARIAVLVEALLDRGEAPSLRLVHIATALRRSNVRRAVPFVHDEPSWFAMRSGSTSIARTVAFTTARVLDPKVARCSTGSSVQ